MDNSIFKRFHKTLTEEQRTWRKRAKVDELTEKAATKKLSEDEMALFESLLNDLYPTEGLGGKTRSNNLRSWKREWKSMQESQEMLTK